MTYATAELIINLSVAGIRECKVVDMAAGYQQ